MTDKDILLSDLNDISEILNNNGYGGWCKTIRKAIALLKEQETIVRCISCAFYRSDGQCALHDDRWKPEGFCSWAIRKKGR